MKIKILFIFFQILSNQQYVQNSSPLNDTRIFWLPLLSSDIIRIETLIESGKKANYYSPQTALILADQAIRYSITIQWSKGYLEALLLKSKCLDLIGNYNEALQLGFKALEISNELSDNIGRANSLRQIGGMYEALGDNNRALFYLQRGYSLSIKIGFLKGIASSLNDIGRVYQNRSEYSKALEYFTKSIIIKNRIGDKQNASNSYLSIAKIYLVLNNYELAIENQLKSLKLCEEIGNQLGIAHSYEAIGATKLLSNDFNEALSYFQNCLQISIKHSSKLQIANQLSNIGLIYDHWGDCHKALKYHTASLLIHLNISNKEGESIAYTNLGNTFSNMKNFDTAVVCLKKSILLDQKLGNIYDLTEDYVVLSRIYFRKGDYLSSWSLCNKAELILSASPLLGQQQELLELKSQLLEKQGNFKASLAAYKRFITLRDSVLNQNKKVAVALKEAKYEFDKKALSDSLKNMGIQNAKDLQIKIQDSQLQKQKLKQNTMLAGIVLLLAIGWLFYSRYKAVSLQRVSERKLLLLEKEQALVEERTRIADEMHDDVGADLSNLLLKIRMNENTKNDSEDIDLKGLKSSTNGIIYKIDEIIWSLNADRDTLNELVNFIVKYYDTIVKENHLKGNAQIQQTLPALPISAKLRRNIFLIVKEILNNTLKHSKASAVELRVEFVKEVLEIGIYDNGQGFDVDKAYYGNGLKNMRKRIEICAASFNIKSTPQLGTQIVLSIPLS